MYRIVIVAIAATLIAGCGSSTSDADVSGSDADLSGSQADAGSDIDIDNDDQPDITISMGDDLEEDRSCEVLEPDRILAIVPEMDELTVNPGVSFGPNSCSYDAGDQTNVYLTVYPEGGDAAGIIEQSFGIDNSSEVRPLDNGVSLWRDGIYIEVIAVEAGGAVATLQQAGRNVIPIEAWEGPLAEYLTERLAAIYG